MHHMKLDEVRAGSETSARVVPNLNFHFDNNGMPVFLNNLASYDDADHNMRQAEGGVVINSQTVKYNSVMKSTQSKLINRKSTIPLNPVRSNNISP